MRAPRKQTGFLLIMAAVIIMIAAVMAAVLVTMNSESANGGSSHAVSTQALYAAESGLEYEQRRMALNVDWYRSATDPTATVTQTVGGGTYTTSSKLIATTVRDYTTTTATTICVYTVQRFPTSGYAQIGDDVDSDAEFIQYTGTTSASGSCPGGSALTGVTRGIPIAAIPSPAAARTHQFGTTVYPVTTLIDPLSASATCVAPTQLRITDNAKFLDSGTITLYNGDSAAPVYEDIFYSSSTHAGGVMTLTGITRLLGTSCTAWNAGAPLTPLLSASPGGSVSVKEAQAISVGTVGNAVRTLNLTLQQ